jgi:MYXO-CTERM domain-containing protein
MTAARDRRIIGIAATTMALFGFAAASQAGIISVSGPLSTAGTAAAIIAAPSDVLDGTVTNTGQQGFNEAQGVVTSMAYATDSGVIAAGTLVDSQMIFLNQTGTGTLIHTGVTWKFDGLIIGVMSDFNGTLETASSFELGAAGTNYTVGAGAAPFAARGMEGGDGYTVLGSSLLVNMSVVQPGDWIRVVTVRQVSEPGTLAVVASGLLGLALIRRRRTSRRQTR